MLVRNGSTLFQNPGVFRGIVSNRVGNYVKGGLQNRMYGGFSQTFGAYPNGYLASKSFIFPIKSGSLSSYTLASGIMSGSITLIPAKVLEGSASATLTVTNAQLDRIINMLASAACSIVGDLNLGAAVSVEAASTMAISKLSAILGGIFDISADGSAILSADADMGALANMIAEAGGPTPLSPEGLAEAVWNSILSDYQITGSAGKALTDSGGAGNPWAAILEDNKDPGTFGKHVQELLKRNFYLGTKD